MLVVGGVNGGDWRMCGGAKERVMVYDVFMIIGDGDSYDDDSYW